MRYVCAYSSPLGEMTMESDGKFLTGLWFDGQKYFGGAYKGAREARALPVFEDTTKWLDLYFSGQRPDFTPPLLPEGSPFRREVWEVLLSVAYGKTITYGEIAAQLARGGKAYAQAVGGAVGHNPISIIVPCHRVLGKDGSLTGYAGGTDKKRALLEMEGIFPKG